MLRKLLRFSIIVIIVAFEGLSVNGINILNTSSTISSQQDFQLSDAKVTVSNGCATACLGSSSYNGNPTIPEKRWMETPSVVEVTKGHFRVLGRSVHLNFLKEQLQDRGVNFANPVKSNEAQPAIIVDVLADSIYLQGQMQLFGIRTLNIHARVIMAATASVLDVSAPAWNQVFRSRITTNSVGENGKHGIPGPQVSIHADVIRGAFRIVSNGGAGSKGQDGGPGSNAADNTARKPDVSKDKCSSQSGSKCKSVAGTVGDKGRAGGKGGNAGLSGNGGNAGLQKVFVNTVEGNVELRSCAGNGAPAPAGGAGGNGGLGSYGSYGRVCRVKVGAPKCFGCSGHRYCSDGGKSKSKGDRGPRGDRGTSGKTPSNGVRGTFTANSIQSRALDSAQLQTYPLVLLRIMKRHAEDLLWSNKVKEGKEVLMFIKLASAGRDDAKEYHREAKRRLVFVDKPGFDMFGNNKLFAPRIKWEPLKTIVEGIREVAMSYENSYNSLSEAIEGNQDFQQLAMQMSAVAEVQVKVEKERLIESRLIAESEKRLYVKAIAELENGMNNVLVLIESILPEAYSKTQFNTDDLLAVMQASVGFFSAVVSKDPLGLIDTAVGAASLSKANCPLGSLEQVMDKLSKWLTFGKSYTALENSSDLDFDQVDVASVPEVMQVNLEMNKESLTTELVCLLDVQSRPQDLAELKELIEQFFISGSARIDLIAKVMDLDNDIGGLNFDIPLLEETEQALLTVTTTTDAPNTKDLQVQFMDNLLSTYQELEGAFMKEVYELYKAFKFRTLWETEDPLPQFQRVTSEGVQGGKLNGILELTNVLRSIESLETKALKCFTNNIYTTDIQRWSFDQKRHPTMFREIQKNGSTRFSIDVTQSCTSCFNIRLIKMYVELTGEEEQAASVPSTVHLQVRHSSASFFRTGDGTIREYRQPLGSFRKMKFRRFAVSDEAKCGQEERKGFKNSIFCVTPNDERWQPMCSQTSCDDVLLGEEECRSPFGTYELVIPVDNNMSCDDPGIRNKNCKDLDLNKFTKMNVWAQFYYWSEVYPTGPDDRTCRSPVPAGVA